MTILSISFLVRRLVVHCGRLQRLYLSSISINFGMVEVLDHSNIQPTVTLLPYILPQLSRNRTIMVDRMDTRPRIRIYGFVKLSIYHRSMLLLITITWQ